MNLLALTVAPFKNVYLRFAPLLPNVLAMLVILLVGIIAARTVKTAAYMLLTAVNFDKWSEEMGFSALLRKTDVWTKPSHAVALFLYWAVLFVALLAAMTALNATLVDAVIADILAYLPKLLSAVLIVIVGSIAAGLVSRALLMSLVNSGIGSARRYAQAARVLMFVILIAIALEQLRIAPGIIVAAFSIAFGGVVLALAIASGIAGVDVIRKIIHQHSADQEGVDINQP